LSTEDPMTFYAHWRDAPAVFPALGGHEWESRRLRRSGVADGTA
jgi:hypothetical protein